MERPFRLKPYFSVLLLESMNCCNQFSSKLHFRAAAGKLEELGVLRLHLRCLPTSKFLSVYLILLSDSFDLLLTLSFGPFSVISPFSDSLLFYTVLLGFFSLVFSFYLSCFYVLCLFSLVQYHLQSGKIAYSKL